MAYKFKLGDEAAAQEELERRGKAETRQCRECGHIGPSSEFGARLLKHMGYIQVSFRNSCDKCIRARNVDNVKKSKRKDIAYSRACSYWQRSSKLGEKSDLKVRDVRELLACPCYYCETRQSDITLDRKDSARGYIKSNVVPCCFRCNTLKSDMPWEAWKNLIPAVKNAAKLGLFADWRKAAASSSAARVATI